MVVPTTSVPCEGVTLPFITIPVFLTSKPTVEVPVDTELDGIMGEVFNPDVMVEIPIAVPFIPVTPPPGPQLFVEASKLLPKTVFPSILLQFMIEAPLGIDMVMHPTSALTTSPFVLGVVAGDVWKSLCVPLLVVCDKFGAVIVIAIVNQNIAPQGTLIKTNF